MGNQFTTIVMLGLMVVAFYFLLIRPQRKRQQAQQRTMSELTPGTRVLLGSGLFGTLTWVGTKQATLETAPGVELTVLKQAIARVVTPGDEYSEPDDVDELEEIDEVSEEEPVDSVERPAVDGPSAPAPSAPHPTASDSSVNQATPNKD